MSTTPRPGVQDTSPAALDAQVEVYRRLSPARRLEIAIEMSLLARALLRARVAGEHPDWSDRQLTLEVLRHTLPGGRLPACAGMTARDLLRRILGKLEDAGIASMLTGSFASSYHGIPRATQDIDLVITATAEQVSRLVRALPPADYYVDEQAALDAHHHQTQFNIIDLATGWKIDLIVRKDRPFSRTEFERRIRTEVEGVSLHVATAEDIVLAKLEWARMSGSSRQLEDVIGLLRVRGPLDQAYLARWVGRLGVDAEWETVQASLRQGQGHRGE